MSWWLFILLVFLQVLLELIIQLDPGGSLAPLNYP